MEEETKDAKNLVLIGDLQLFSKIESMDALLEKAKALLKDKGVLGYLTYVKNKKAFSGSYTG